MTLLISPYCFKPTMKLCAPKDSDIPTVFSLEHLIVQKALLIDWPTFMCNVHVGEGTNINNPPPGGTF